MLRLPTKSVPQPPVSGLAKHALWVGRQPFRSQATACTTGAVADSSASWIVRVIARMVLLRPDIGDRQIVLLEQRRRFLRDLGHALMDRRGILAARPHPEHAADLVEIAGQTLELPGLADGLAGVRVLRGGRARRVSES